MVTLVGFGGCRDRGVTAVHACGCNRGGPYLFLPTGIWHVKICSCSRIVIHLRYNGKILAFIGLFTWQRKCSKCVLHGFRVDNRHTYLLALSQDTFSGMQSVTQSHLSACARCFVLLGF